MTEAKKRVKSATTVLIEQKNCFPKRWKDKIEKPMFALNWKYWNHFIISRNQRYLASENNNEGKLFVWKGKGEVDLTGKRGELCVCLFWASLNWQSRCVRVALSLLLARSRLSPVNRVDRLVAGVRRKERQREMKKRERGNTSLFMFRLKIEWQSFYNKECPLDFPFDSIRRYKCTCRAESIWSDCISFMIEHYSPIYSFEITKFLFVLFFFWKRFRALVFWSNQMPFGIEWKLNWNRRASVADLILCHSQLKNIDRNDWWGLTRRIECCPSVRRCPCWGRRHRRRIRIPSVRTCERDKPYRRARSRECWHWSNPTSCCTGLHNNQVFQISISKIDHLP